MCQAEPLIRHAALLRAGEYAQPLEAMQAQLQAMAACVREEQAARIAAEEGSERSQHQVIALVAQLNDVQRLRVQADESLRGVQSLVATLQAENELLRQQNITIASETRQLQLLEDHRPRGAGL